MMKTAKVFGLALLLLASGSAFATITVLNVIGIGTTYSEARADARSQANATCTSMGGTLGYFEVVDSISPGGNVHVYAYGECHH